MGAVLPPRPRVPVPTAVAVAAAAAVVLLLTVLALAGRAGTPAAEAATRGLDVRAVQVRVPDAVTAGEQVSVELVGLQTGTTTSVLLAGTAGSTVVEVEGDAAGVVRVPLPSALVRVRGVVTVHVAGVVVGALDVAPGTPTGVLAPYVGPRSIVTGGADHTMVTVIPLDVHGNPVAAGTSVAITARRPDGELVAVADAVEGLLAWTRVPSGTVAGRTELRTDVAGTDGPVGDVLEVAGDPEPFDLVVPAVPGPADGRRVVEVATEVLVDRFGNVLADGTAVVFSLDGPDGRGTLPAVAVAGVATAQLRAPARPGDVVVVAHVGATASRPATLAFTTTVGELPARVVPDGGRWRVIIGPVLDPLGSHVPDGTGVEVAGPVDAAAADLVDGRAEVVLVPGSGPVVVTVAGTRVEVTP